MAEFEIPVIGDTQELRTQVQTGLDQAVICRLGRGLLRFSDAIFPNVPRDEIYAQFNAREAEGRGPHFDVYKDFINPDHSVLGVFNLEGEATVTTTSLARELADNYDSTYPEPNDDAFTARRHFAAIALANPMAVIYQGSLSKDTGLVLPQGPNVLPVVHNIVPVNSELPGEYVKLVVPAKTKSAKRRMENGGYEPLDEFLTNRISSEPRERKLSKIVTLPERLGRAADDASRNRQRQSSYEMPRRSCNLD